MNEHFFETYQDHLARHLDTYEQAIYLYIYRHTILTGKLETVIGFKSARKNMAFGIGSDGTPMAEGTCYRKLQSLASKGCVQLLDSKRDGTAVRIVPPQQVPLVVKELNRKQDTPKIEELDFFEVLENRKLILEREQHRCFYCLKKIGADIRYIQAFLGHQNLDTTKIYLRLVPGRLKDEYDEAMPEIAVGLGPA